MVYTQLSLASLLDLNPPNPLEKLAQRRILVPLLGATHAEGTSAWLHPLLKGDLADARPPLFPDGLRMRALEVPSRLSAPSRGISRVFAFVQTCMYTVASRFVGSIKCINS